MRRRHTLWLVAAVALLAGCAGRADRTGDEPYREPSGASSAPSTSAPAAPTTPPETPGQGTEQHSPTPTPAPAASEALVPRVTVEEARALHQSGEAVFVDVRDMASFGSAHIPGALPIPLLQLGSRLDELPRDRRIIAYCA
jgi:hypothetical protein